MQRRSFLSFCAALPFTLFGLFSESKVLPLRVVSSNLILKEKTKEKHGSGPWIDREYDTLYLTLSNGDRVRVWADVNDIINTSWCEWRKYYNAPFDEIIKQWEADMDVVQDFINENFINENNYRFF